uniref:Syringolide-induced protein 14-1-1 n=1 Tax=Leersia perrieri TaxID=77586 RepID=A0A0D9XG77_9ORYZ
METKPTKHHHHHKHARSRSFGGGAIVSFLKNTAASFSTTTTSTSTATKRPSSFNHRNAFSGPIAVSIVPPAARGGSRRDHRSGYKTPEPSSPKVSCIGQIKKAKSKKLCKNGVCPLPPRPPAAAARQNSSLVRRMLFRRSRSRSASSRDTGSNGGLFKGRKSTSSTAVAAAPAPGLGLGQMKRFTSGRTALEDFDWREVEEDDEDEVFVAHSAPLVMGGGVVASEPRKEVNLWSRRPMAPPTPLRLP